jgi:hypothetical protein
LHARRLAIVPLVFLAALAGCASLASDESRTAGIGLAAPATSFRQASLAYQAEAPAYAVRQAGYAAIFPLGEVDSRAAGEPRLAIVYPHPDGLEWVALAEVVVPKADRANGAPADTGWRRWFAQTGRTLRESMPGMRWHEGVQEAWALDVPAADLDVVFRELDREGYFGRGESPRAEVVLQTQIDGKRIAKHWTRSEALDQLIARVREEGRLISHTRAPDPHFRAPEPGPTTPAAGRDREARFVERPREPAIEQEAAGQDPPLFGPPGA